MKITVKDEAELQSTVDSMLQKAIKKGLTNDAAHALVKDYLSENKFQNEEGHELTLSLEVEEPKEEKSVKDIVKKAVATKVRMPKAIEASDVEVTEDWERLVSQKNFGFKNVAEQAQAVLRYGKNIDIDPRLSLIAKAHDVVTSDNYQRINKGFGQNKAAPSSYASEYIGADGGFLVAPEFSDKIFTAYSNEEGIRGLCDQNRTSKNQVHFPADETTPWGTSGPQAYWVQQGVAITASKPSFQQRAEVLATIAVLIPVADHLFEDTALLETWISKKVPMRINWAIDDAIVRGNGGGQPLGVLKGPGTISVTRATALAITLADIDQMFARLLPGTLDYSPGTVWLMDKVTRSKIAELTTGSSATLGFPIGLKNFTIENGVLQTMYGLPIRTSLHCSSLGTAGDVILGDFGNGYAYYEHTTGMEAARSAHLYFDALAQAVRYSIRCAGQPLLKAAVAAPNDVTNSMSHFVTLTTKLS